MRTTDTHPLWLVEAITLRTETYWNRNGRRFDDTYLSVIAIENASAPTPISAIREAVEQWCIDDIDISSAIELRATLIPEQDPGDCGTDTLPIRRDIVIPLH